ncbi:chemotaxis protein CheW [Halioglobus japonicus]|uniref:Chemotaxis protein CheW n=1 Tax=Halioglobus japonicus TaxID=930805 RepID=A0AAP8ME10_9GAMM|nr:chemotaxis protein CheW [Halioglobus japonicus]AQA18116.1 chemotaxis protein CheW [Halioglobus japonicus]PLW86110.1 chemotaxis protein CheW [Halioglobus japonicus]GHD14426.1 chemotaxis protein CheW [Halioglobus japonicus]
MNNAAAIQDDIVGVPGDNGQYLTFILANEEYGVEILRVQEIRGWSKVTPLPNSPEYLKGVINLRGTIVPIIDLRERFSLEPLEYGSTTVVIVVRVENGEEDRVMGLVVDAVSEVYTLGDSQCQLPPEFGSRLEDKFVKSLASVEDKMIIVLDVDAFLNVDVKASLE